MLSTTTRSSICACWIPNWCIYTYVGIYDSPWFFFQPWTFSSHIYIYTYIYTCTLIFKISLLHCSTTTLQVQKGFRGCIANHAGTTGFWWGVMHSWFGVKWWQIRWMHSKQTPPDRDVLLRKGGNEYVQLAPHLYSIKCRCFSAGISLWKRIRKIPKSDIVNADAIGFWGHIRVINWRHSL